MRSTLKTPQLTAEQQEELQRPRSGVILTDTRAILIKEAPRSLFVLDAIEWANSLRVITERHADEYGDEVRAMKAEAARLEDQALEHDLRSEQCEGSAADAEIVKALRLSLVANDLLQEGKAQMTRAVGNLHIAQLLGTWVTSPEEFNPLHWGHPFFQRTQFAWRAIIEPSRVMRQDFDSYVFQVLQQAKYVDLFELLQVDETGGKFNAAMLDESDAHSFFLDLRGDSPMAYATEDMQEVTKFCGRAVGSTLILSDLPVENDDPEALGAWRSGQYKIDKKIAAALEELMLNAPRTSQTRTGMSIEDNPAGTMPVRPEVYAPPVTRESVAEHLMVG